MEVELTLKQRLLHEINIRSKSFVAELVKISGYSNLQNFKRCLTSDREFDKFQNIIDVVEFIWGDRVVEIIGKFSYEIDENRKNARQMLEFLSTNRQLEAFKCLLDRMEKCCNKESKEFAKVYSLQYEAQSKYPNVDIDDLIHRAQTMKTTTEGTTAFRKLFKVHAYYQKGDFFMTMLLSKEISYLFDFMDDDYLKHLYNARLSEIMSYVHLRVRNEPEKSRKYANSVLMSKAGKPFKAFAHFMIGYSYFFSNYEYSLHNLIKSRNMYDEMKRDFAVKDLDEKIELLKVYWDKQGDQGCHYIKNYFLYNIKKGVNVKKALEESKNEINDEPFYLYLKGYLEQDEEILIESVLLYIHKGDSFLANFGKTECIKLGHKEHLLNLMLKIRVS